MSIRLIFRNLLTISFGCFVLVSCENDDIVYLIDEEPIPSQRIIKLDDMSLWCQSLADVDGDGKSDLVWRLGTEIHVALSTGHSFNQDAIWTYCSPNAEYRLADVDGDSKTDIISRIEDNIEVALSSGYRFIPSVRWCNWDKYGEINLADANGDGRADLIGQGGCIVALSDGISFKQSLPWCVGNSTQNSKLSDLDGDMDADLISILNSDIYVALSTGSSFQSFTNWIQLGINSEFKLADVNGDGKNDIIRRTGNVIEVATSTGLNFKPFENWSYWNPKADYQFADVNGDGMADIVGRLNNTIHVGLSTGKNFASSAKWSEGTNLISSYINQINKENLIQHVNRLCSFGNRGVFTNLVNAATYIDNQFKEMGYTVTREKVIYDGNYWGDNIVATKLGTTSSNYFLEFTSHYDSNYNAGDRGGAKDNATGVASVLEIARVLANYNNKNSIRFIAFAAEEKGVYKKGSNIHVNSLIQRGEKVIAALNIDTPGTGNPVSNMHTKDDHFMTIWYRSVASYELTKIFTTVVGSYSIPLTVYPEDIKMRCQSDEYAYALNGLVAVTTLGDWRHSLFHTRKDTPENVNFNNVFWIAQANLAVGITLDQ